MYNIDWICLTIILILTLKIGLTKESGGYSFVTMLSEMLDALGSLLTFPGIILREAFRKLYCDVTGVPIYALAYLKPGYQPGFVRHGEVNRYVDSFLLVAGPFIINSLLAIAMFIPFVLWSQDLIGYLFLWAGLSFAVQAMPRDENVQDLYRQSPEALKRNSLALAAYTLVVFLAFAGKLKNYLRINLLYAAILFSVTFCIIAIVLTIGSVVLPGVYTLDIGTGSSHVVQTTNWTASTANMTQVQKNVVRQAVLAKAWLQAADAAVKKENSSAVLIFVGGNSNYQGTPMPIDGTAHTWLYWYALPEEKILYEVYVQDGALESISRRNFTIGGVEDYLCQLPDPGIGNWSRDSDAATKIANAVSQEIPGMAAASGASYRLEVDTGSNAGRLEWIVTYYNDHGTALVYVVVDEETGTVLAAFRGPE